MFVDKEVRDISLFCTTEDEEGEVEEEEREEKDKDKDKEKYKEKEKWYLLVSSQTAAVLFCCFPFP
jgi:hypothetical protein